MVPGLPCHRSTRWTASGSDCRTVDVQTSLDEIGQPVQACLHLIQLSSEYRQQVHGDCDWETDVADQLDKLVHVVPPWQGVEKKGVQDGEGQTGQEVGQFDLLQTQHVDTNGDDHKAARGRQLVEDVWLHQEPQGGTQQGQTALDDEHRDSAECHPAAQCRGERYADDPVSYT